MLRLAILAVALLASTPSLSGQQSERADAAALAHRLEVVIPRFLEVTGTPSVSVAVLRDGASIVRRAWGLDRSILTGNANAYFSKQAVADLASGLAPLGPPAYFYTEYETKRGDMIRRGFIAWFAERSLHVTTMQTADGRLEQFHVAPAPPQWR